MIHEYRIAGHGHLINDKKPISFIFDNAEYEGYEGDTVASALLAEGVCLFGRSFKYHRRRSVMAANEAEANALMTIIHPNGEREPNRPATTIPLSEGLVMMSQNRYPSLESDIMEINDKLSKFMPAGFYYKTFIGPMQKSWMWFEPFIRRAAGLGTAGYEKDTQQYDHYASHPQVLIIGSGLSGLMTAYGLGKAGVKVLLLEQSKHLGGHLLSYPKKSKEVVWLQNIIAELHSMENVTIATETSAFGWYDHNIIGALEQPKGDKSMRLWRIYADKVILASGAMERPIGFGNNDLPNIMLNSAVRFYLNANGVLPGRNIIIYSNDNSAFATALDIKHSVGGDADVMLIDARKRIAIADELLQEAERANVIVHTGTVVLKAHGKKQVTGVDIVSYDLQEDILGRDIRRFPCDLLAVAGGWTPTLHLHSQIGDKPIYNEKLSAFVPQPKDEDGHFCIGGCRGTYGRKAIMAEAIDTTERILADMNKSGGDINYPPMVDNNYDGQVSKALFFIKAHKGYSQGKIFLDMQNDVSVADVELANLEGYDSVEHMKRYTTLGMATDQGKTSNMPAFHILAALQGKGVEELGTTTFRPPYTAVPIGALAGREVGSHFRPLRKIPLHDWHIEKGAKMINTVAWQRPWYYPIDEDEGVGSAYIREMTHVRNEVGMVDVSTLGKIIVAGPDAAEFLNRIYVNGFKALAIGRCRYGVMLRDDGFALDDGTVTRTGEYEYFMTTTTVEAEVVYRRLEFLLECEWQDLKVHVVSVSDEWCGLALAGPKAGDVLKTLVVDDISDETLPFMSYMEADLRLERGKVRIFRISFSGELGYELYVKRSQAKILADACLETGENLGLKLYGLEAMGGLRIEKGFLTSAEIDGRHSLMDLGLEEMASSKKDFLGNALSQRDEFLSAMRPILVGLKALDSATKFRNGSLVYDETGTAEGHGIGHVTSVTWSPTLGCYIALAFVAGGKVRKGERIRVGFPLRDEVVSAEVTDLDFLAGATR